MTSNLKKKLDDICKALKAPPTMDHLAACAVGIVLGVLFGITIVMKWNI